MTAELENMKEVGINKVLFLEVDLGIPNGPVQWMSEPWQNTFVAEGQSHILTQKMVGLTSQY